MSRIYVGRRYSAENPDVMVSRIFRSKTVPTHESHGSEFIYVIGPFRTVRGAEMMAMYGHNNPHLQTVGDAERMAERASK